MRAGRLRFRVCVEEATEERNAVGEVVQVWAPVKTIYASIDPLRGEERLTMQQVKATIDTKITARTLAVRDVTAKMRFTYGERVFDIDSSIDFQSRGIFSEIFCKEQAA